MKLEYVEQFLPQLMQILAKVMDKIPLILTDTKKVLFVSPDFSLYCDIKKGDLIESLPEIQDIINGFSVNLNHIRLHKDQIIKSVISENGIVEGYLVILAVPQIHHKYKHIFSILEDMNNEIELEAALHILTKQSIEMFDNSILAGIWLWRVDYFEALSVASHNADQGNFLLNSTFPSTSLIVDTLINISQQKHKILIEKVEEGDKNLKLFLPWYEQLEKLGITHIASIPLLHFGQLLGIYAIFLTEELNVEDFSWLDQFMPLISSFVYEQQMRSAAFEREQALTLLLRGTEILVQVESEEQLLREAGEMAMEILYLEAGVFLLKSEDGEWQIKAPFGRLRQIEAPWETWMRNYIDSHGGDNYQPKSVSTFVDLDVTAWSEDAVYRWKKVLIQPLQVHNGIIGELWLINSNVEELEERQEILAAFVRVLGVALETIRQRKELERLALTDRLTGIFNRQGFEQRIREMMDSVVRRDSSLLFLILDLDYFKNLNDTKGHLAGDEALKRVAHNLRRSVRSYDLVARTGGDEFIVVLSDLKNDREGNSIVERLKNSLQLEKDNLDVTIGVAEFPREASDYENLYRLADQRLYKGKHLGRGRIISS